MNTYPIKECQQVVDGLKRRAPDISFRQQFNCQNCHTKQTMAEADKWYTRGTCEVCGAETDITKDGCNYMLAVPLGKATPWPL